MGFQTTKEMGFIFLKKYARYFFVLFVFFLSVVLHSFIIPVETSKKQQIEKEVSSTRNPDLDAKHTEKMYEDLFQSRSGDVFRVGAYFTTEEKEKIEILLQSSLNEELKVGEWELLPGEKEEYKELTFSPSGRYENIVFRMQTEKGGTEEKWDDSKVFIHSFFLTRVQASNDLALQNLQPTLFGLSAANQQELFSEKENVNSENTHWRFQAKGDFLQALEFSGKFHGNGRQQFIFELFRFNQQKKEKEGQYLQRASFILEALDDLRVSSGNYFTPFSFPLEEGQWYEIVLKKDESKNSDGNFTMMSLATDRDGESSIESGDLLLHTGVHTRVRNGVSLLDRTRLEDLGDSLFYSFTYQHEPVDYSNLQNASNGIVFDEKKHVVVGGQKNGEFFTYKFDTIYPFDKLALQAMQKGNDEKEIKLEYSFDNAFWKEIAYQQERGGSQHFRLLLPGDKKNHVLYVRASYNGEEKKSGFFALEELEVNASVPKP